MNKLIIYFMLLAMFFIACDPIENRESIGGAITIDQLEIKATPVVVNGKNSNKIILENHSPVLSSWDYGMGTTTKAYEEVLLVLTGESDIVFTGLNPDGTKITKTLKVNVEELSFEVPKEWALLCGDGSKVWVWDDSQPVEDKGPIVFGKGAYLNDFSPTAWSLGLNEMNDQVVGEGSGATMTFSAIKSKFVKTKSDGTSVTGSFSFDMNKKIKNLQGDIWSKGKFYTKSTSILCGFIEKEVVYEYNIMTLDETKMVLSYQDPKDAKTAYFWMFKAK